MAILFIIIIIRVCAREIHMHRIVCIVNAVESIFITNATVYYNNTNAEP